MTAHQASQASQASQPASTRTTCNFIKIGFLFLGPKERKEEDQFRLSIQQMASTR